MANDLLTSFSTQLADTVAGASPSVVQVQGRRSPASGVVYANDVVLTTVGALGREDHLQVRRDDGRALDAELTGWDPTTSLAVLRAEGLEGSPFVPSTVPPRVGNLALAVARSWSNVVTASAGIISVIGGPLPTGRRRATRPGVGRHQLAPVSCRAASQAPPDRGSASSSLRRADVCESPVHTCVSSHKDGQVVVYGLLKPKVTQEQIVAEAQRVPGVKDVQLLVHPWPSVLTGAAAAP